MKNWMRDFAENLARDTYNDAVDDKLVSPVAQKLGGCATIVFVVLFSALGIGAAVLVGRLGGDVDAVGPIAVGVGLFGGILVGAISGTAVSRLLRRLLSR